MAQRGVMGFLLGRWGIFFLLNQRDLEAFIQRWFVNNIKDQDEKGNYKHTQTFCIKDPISNRRKAIKSSSFSTASARDLLKAEIPVASLPTAFVSNGWSTTARKNNNKT